MIGSFRSLDLFHATHEISCLTAMTLLMLIYLAFQLGDRALPLQLRTVVLLVMKTNSVAVGVF